MFLLCLFYETLYRYKSHTKGYSSYFCMSTELVDRLLRANQKVTLERVLKQYANYDVLVIDEVGYLPFSRESATLLFH